MKEIFGRKKNKSQKLMSDVGFTVAGPILSSCGPNSLTFRFGCHLNPCIAVVGSKSSNRSTDKMG